MAVVKKMQELAKLKLPTPNPAPTRPSATAPAPPNTTPGLTVEQFLDLLEKAQRSAA